MIASPLLVGVNEDDVELRMAVFPDQLIDKINQIKRGSARGAGEQEERRKKKRKKYIAAAAASDTKRKVIYTCTRARRGVRFCESADKSAMVVSTNTRVV